MNFPQNALTYQTFDESLWQKIAFTFYCQNIEYPLEFVDKHPQECSHIPTVMSQIKMIRLQTCGITPLHHHNGNICNVAVGK